MPNLDDNNIDKEIEEGLARAGKMLRKQYIQRGLLVLAGILVLVAVFVGGRWTATPPPAPIIVTATFAPVAPTEKPTDVPVLPTDTLEPVAPTDEPALDVVYPYGTLLIQETVIIKSDYIWYDTEIQVEKGDWVITKYRSGSWTIDFNKYPYVDGKGYEAPTCQGCSMPMVNKNLGEMVFEIGTYRGSMGNGITFQASESGHLLMMMNDYYQALGDNAGSITMDVSIYRP